MAEVLIIDDNIDFNAIYRRKLSKKNIFFDFCSSIKDAKVLFQYKTYKLVLVSDSLVQDKRKGIKSYFESLGFAGRVGVLTFGRQTRLELSEYNGTPLLGKELNAKVFSDSVYCIMHGSNDEIKSKFSHKSIMAKALPTRV